MWRWYVEQVMRAHARTVQDLHSEYYRMLPGPDRDCVKGAMAAMSMMLERMNTDYPKVLRAAEATGETPNASFGSN